MIVVSTKDFRANQSIFMDMANKGEDVILKSKRNGSFKLVPIEEESISKQNDINDDLRGALQQVKEHLEGKRKLKTLEEVINEL